MEKIVEITPNFSKGLIPVIAQDYKTFDVLMLAYMNQEAWEKTISTGEAHYFSRSRNKLWHKGEESGNIQKVHSIRIDCDDDTILLLIEQIGDAACHTGYKSCFYRELKDGNVSLCSPKIFDPKKVYNKN